MKSPPSIQSPTLNNLRRRVIPLTATAAAAMGLTGCGIFGIGGSPAKNDTSLTPESTADQVRAFTAGLDEALAKVDRDKFRAAALQQSEDGEAVSPLSVDDPARVGSARSGSPEFTLPASLFAPDYPVVLPTALPDCGAMLTMMSFTEPAAKPAPAGTAVKTAAPARPAESAATVEAALETLHARILAHPTLNTALALALLENAEGRTPDPATIPVSQTLSPNDQKLLQDLLTGLQGMNSTTAAATLAERAVPLVDVAKKWQGDADLTLPKLALASRVDSYGVYTSIDPKFPAGKKQTVIIYCEVANFSAKKTDDGWYETRLSQQETLATDDGLLLWRPNAEEVNDRSKNLRHDFYLVKKLTIPDDLAVGKYALRMSVTDKNTNKIAVVTLPIEITN